MADGIQKMYEHQEMKGYGGYEYVVRGAEVSCSYGSKTCVLNLKDDHGVHTSDGRPLITENDSTNDNIKGFGMCNKNRSKPCKCAPKLGKWWVTDNSNMKIFDTAVGEESDAVTEDSIAACNKGGIVSFKTSGQTSPSYDNVKIKDAVEIVEDEKKNWSRKSDRKDFIGHVKVKNSGLYNFGIEFYDIKSGNSPGSIFVYEKSWGKTKYIGAYEIKSHAGNKEMKFPDDVLKINGNSYGYVSGLHYWFYWIDIILYGGKDYYFEVDCPGRDGFDYKLIGNVDEVSYTGKTTTISNGDKLIPYSGGMYWMLDREVELMSQKVYELSAVVRFVMYLDSDYATAIYDLLCKNYIDSKIEDNKDIISGVISSLKAMVITAVGVVNTEAGVILSAYDILMSGLPQSGALELIRKLKKHVKYVKKINGEEITILNSIRLNIVVIHPMTMEDNYFDLKNPYSRVEEYKCEVQDWNSQVNDKVQGEKYFKGKFTDMKKVPYIYQKEVLMKDFIEKLSNILPMLPNE